MYLSRKVFIEPPKIVTEEPVEEVEAVEETRGEFTGPTVEDIRREAERFRKDWEKEKERLLTQAQAEAEKIRKDAEKVAFDEVKRKNNQAQKIRAGSGGPGAGDTRRVPAEGGGPRIGHQAARDADRARGI